MKTRIMIPLKNWSRRDQITRERSGCKIRRERVNRTGSHGGGWKNNGRRSFRLRRMRRKWCVLFFKTDLLEFGDTRTSSRNSSFPIVITLLFFRTRTSVIISIVSNGCFATHFYFFLGLVYHIKQRDMLDNNLYKKRKKKVVEKKLWQKEKEIKKSLKVGEIKGK